MNTTVTDIPTVAIIGAGQLGFLLCEAAKPLGIKTLVVTPDETAPAIQIADAAIVAPLESDGLAAEIAAQVDVVTFEFEAVAEPLLAGLKQQESEGRIRINPAVEVLSLLKNKARQKAWFLEQGFPTAGYQEVTAEQAADPDFVSQLSVPLVQKSQEGGYDGYGVQILHTEAELKNFWPVPSIVETFLGGARELGVVTVRSEAGETVAYPPVELAVDQARNILDVVIAPAQLPAAVMDEARALGTAVSEALGGVGVFAIEMFLMNDTEILINEVSPRVHNSGHHSLESADASQFEQHMRAVAGLPLGSTEQARPAVMKNILYDDSFAPLVGLPPGRLRVADSSVTVHWYGKKEGRPGRKMGHVSCISDDPAVASQVMDQALRELCESKGD